MKEILLITNKYNLDNLIFNYAKRLAGDVDAKLIILKALKVRDYFDKVAMITAFAEANAPELAEDLLDELEIIIKVGNPVKEFFNYIKSNHNVIMTISDLPYDANIILKERLLVPLITRRKYETI